MAIYRIADLNIDIKNKEMYTTALCKDYYSENQEVAADITAVANPEEFENDRKYVPDASNAYLESLSIYRSISNQMLDYKGFLFHASVIERNGVAFAFSAASGTGKTTHSRLWLECFPDARIINGDKPLVRIKDEKVYIYGTPWCGKERYNINAKAPLAAICFIERAEKNSIKEISKTEAVRRIFPQILVPTDANQVNKLFDLVGEVIDKTPVYLLSCNMDLEAARVAYEGMTNNINAGGSTNA